MGMYTGLRCKVVIKPEYRDEIKRMDELDYEWSESNIDFLKEYSTYSRATFIPCGALSYMPDEWEESTDFNRNFDFETGVWTFQCSLKNYDNTIEHFLHFILTKLISEIIHLEKYYETSDYGILYELQEGNIFRSNNEVIYT
jgi:hypothetical protein